MYSQKENVLNTFIIQSVFTTIDEPDDKSSVAVSHYQSNVGAIKFYQRFISEQIQANCVYEISCSEFTKRQVIKYGLLVGILNGFNQWMSCHTLVLFDTPGSCINNQYKILNDEL